MKSFTLILVETGLQLNIPDLKRASSATFPMWGNFFFLDFCLGNFQTGHSAHQTPARRILVLEGEHRGIQSIVHSTWKHETLEVVPLVGGLSEFIELLELDASELIVLAATSLVAFLGTNEIFDLLDEKEQPNRIKVSVGETPSNLYVIDRKDLIDLLKSFRNRYSASDSFTDFLFNDILLSSFDEIVNIPGEILFQNNLMQLYSQNIDLVTRQRSPKFQAAVQKLSQTTTEGTPSYIGENGFIREAFISSGVEIYGYVENSILFPGVLVKSRTKIINSVIMNNNQIGRNTLIQNALVLPYQREVKKGSSNIGSEVVIGGESTVTKNTQFPNQINRGLTVIGLDADIPRGTVIEQGCYLGSNVSQSRLRSLKHLKRGRSLFADERKN
jgi:hypothetical protein